MKSRLAVAVVLLALGGVLLALPGEVERRYNRVRSHAPHVSAAARELHRKLLVADLHADTLLWGRDLLEHGSRGHVDLPRLVEGGVALQAFTVVTSIPRSASIERNEDASDAVTLLALAQRWPPATWGSRRARALYQAARLQDAVDRSAGRLCLLRSRADLEAFLARRDRELGIVAGFLGLEGAQALEGDAGSVDTLFDAGFRMIGLAHFTDNDFAGSAHGAGKGGLTAKGEDLVRRIEARRMLVDLAHASPRTIEDVLRLATRPVVVSHTGVRGTCDNARNLSDDQLRGIARTGGIVGIGFWETATCGEDAAAVARAIRHAASVIGAGHVAIGSDFDGAITTPFDATGLPELTDALLAAGFGDDDLRGIMGGNAARLLREALP